MNDIHILPEQRELPAFIFSDMGITSAADLRNNKRIL
jgi:hypothetical protein